MRMDPDRETLNAFIDGELPPKEMERIAALLERRPDLDRMVRQQEKLRAKLRDAYPADAPVPEALIRAVKTAPISWRWRLRHWFTGGSSLRVLVPTGAALAAGLAIGLFIGPAADYGTDPAGQLMAQGRLARTLNTALAADGHRGRGAEIGISFRNKAGRDCRTFSNRGDSGLACHESGGWVIETLVKQSQEYPDAAYRMAGSAPALRRAVADSIAGTPFDAAAERRARDHGWQGR